MDREACDRRLSALGPRQVAYHEGRELRAWEFMGAHPGRAGEMAGYHFRVWAPNADRVCIMGDFNGWDSAACPMRRGEGGIWEGFVPGLGRYDAYQYAVHAKSGAVTAKADPYAVHAETRPGTASKIYDLEAFAWEDAAWLRRRAKKPVYHQPLNIYEVHLGSWRRTGDGEFLSYRDLARYLVPYVKEMGFTHVELMPVTEYPLDDSWGYQCTGYFAVTSRYGTPDDFRSLVNELHRAGVGVILDWVPAHFPKDAFGLYEFDGTAAYEYADPRMAEHADWGTRVFDYGKGAVRSFLGSSALFWLEEFHIDGLRVDAVAAMLYRDYGRKDGQWQPNRHGGRENLEVVDFFQRLNEAIFLDHPDVLMIAEESTAWPLVTRPTDVGGLGFNLKWNMGWMNDVQHYMKLDPYFRQFNHKDITFSIMYAFSENFLLPFSHDEVVHMKGSLIGKMPGTDDEKFAQVRAFYTFMLAHPGKKLLFMGAEFGQFREWNFEQSLDWHLLEEERHQRLHAFFKAANALYLAQGALWELDFSWEGFSWICADDAPGNCAIFTRTGQKGQTLFVACNFSPVFRDRYRIGVPWPGRYETLLNTDDVSFGGAGRAADAPMMSEAVPCHGMEQSILLDLPPFSAVIFRCTRRRGRANRRDGPSAQTELPSGGRLEKSKGNQG